MRFPLSLVGLWNQDCATEVAAALFGAKHQEAMDQLKSPSASGLAAALERLRPKLEDPSSIVRRSLSRMWNALLTGL